MRAIRLHGPGDVRVDDGVPEPTPGPGEVLLRPLFNGICGSDLHMWEAGPRQHASRPMILGHEFSAEVVEAGPEVTDHRIRPGVLVAVEPMWTCGVCGPCRTGAYNLCRSMVWHGLSDKGGGMGRLTVVRADMVHVMPEGVSARQAALVEPVSVAHHAAGRSGLAAGDTALVLGGGPIGIACALDLRARGVERIVVSEPSRERRDAVAAALAQAGGADLHVLDPVELGAGFGDAVRDLTAGAGADAAIDAAGVEAAFHAAFAAVRPGGRVVTVAVYMKPVTFHPMEAFLGEVDLVASCGYRDDFPHVVELMAQGAYPLDAWVGTVAAGGVAQAFTDLHAGRALKLLVDVQG